VLSENTAPTEQLLAENAPRGRARWADRRRRKEARRRATELVAAAVVSQALLLVLALQFEVGLLAHVPFARGFAVVLFVLIPVTAAAAVLAPRHVLPVLSAGLQRFGRLVSGALFVLVLAAVFLVSLPFARFRNRSRVLRDHPSLAPWVVRSEASSWRVATWVPKSVSHVESSTSSRSTVLRVLRIFSYQQNYFLLAIAVVLVLFGLLFMFLQTSALAPFIYTLF
jgi:hypothetical protein